MDATLSPGGLLHETPSAMPDPGATDARTLGLRLRQLAADERGLHVEFLRTLDALDRCRGYAELGYPSLWEYCLRALHLREGATARRIGAMRALRKYPQLSTQLSDGRLCLSTLAMLAPLLTPENVDEVAARAAHGTRADVEAIVAGLRAPVVPRAGLRKVAAAAAPEAGRLAAPATEALTFSTSQGPGGSQERTPARTQGTSPDHAAPEPCAQAAPIEHWSAPAGAANATVGAVAGSPRPTPPAPSAVTPSPPTLKARSEEQWSLRVTLDAEARRDLAALQGLLSHRVPRGDLAAVLKEALRCAVEVHGRKRGVRPAGPGRATARGQMPALSQTPAAAGEAAATPEIDALACEAPGNAARDTRTDEPRRPSRYVPSAIRREVWARDRARCTFVAADGTRCNSRWQLELDHVHPYAFGGATTAANLRLRCREHNLLHAERVFGRAHVARCIDRASRSPSASGSSHGAAG